MLFVGMDWSDRSLEFHARTSEGRVSAEGRVDPDVAGLAQLFSALEVHAPPGEIGIAAETAHGAWVQALLDRGYALYPVNPKSAERFREALSAAGNKSDRIDSKVLAMMLAALPGDRKPLRPDAPEIIALRIACEDRVRLVEERTAKLNELLAVVKIYYPAFLGFFGDLESVIAMEFLKEFPCQKAMRTLTPKRLRSWLKRHGYTGMSRIEEMEKQLTAPVLPVAEHLQAAKAPLIRYLATSLLAVKAEIAERERQITDQFDGMPEADWIRSLPGAGPNLAPALLACLGRDPNRFADVSDARAFMGTAPVTKASGRSRVVVFRRG
jgi:transposase